MIKLNQDNFDKANKLITKNEMEATGYRLIVKPIEAELLDAGLAKEYQKLAALGFQSKTEDQRERESVGANFGIVVSIGEHAYNQQRLGSAWVEEGDVVVFHRYSGSRLELPPGSNDFYQSMNDEDLLIKLGNIKDEC